MATVEYDDDSFDDETALEEAACKYAEGFGVCAMKISVDGDTGWPDRLYFGRRFHGAKVQFFVEFKAFGEKANGKQRLVHALIRRQYRVPVYVVDRWSRFLEAWRRETRETP